MLGLLHGFSSLPQICQCIDICSVPDPGLKYQAREALMCVSWAQGQAGNTIYVHYPDSSRTKGSLRADGISWYFSISINAKVPGTVSSTLERPSRREVLITIPFVRASQYEWVWADTVACFLQATVAQCCLGFRDYTAFQT